MHNVDIHEVDSGTDYSVARHMLAELAAHPEGLSADELGSLLGGLPNGHVVGQWLRDLRCRGWVSAQPVSPASTRVRWRITELGRSEVQA